MIAHSEWKHGEVFEGIAENGNTISLRCRFRAHEHGPSPMEAVLMALCGCTSVDVVSILQKKRQTITGSSRHGTATQAPAPPRVFTTSAHLCSAREAEPQSSRRRCLALKK